MFEEFNHTVGKSGDKYSFWCDDSVDALQILSHYQKYFPGEDIVTTWYDYDFICGEGVIQNEKYAVKTSLGIIDGKWKLLIEFHIINK